MRGPCSSHQCPNGASTARGANLTEAAEYGEDEGKEDKEDKEAERRCILDAKEEETRQES